DFDDDIIYICAGGVQNLTVADTFQQYEWSSGETDTASIQVPSPGNYSVTVTDNFGCTQTKNFTVILSEPATIIGADVNDFAGDENSVTIIYSGSGSYEFSLDGANFQNAPIFQGIAAGEYELTINDVNGCGITPPYPVLVMDYPHYFTPNGDGFSDIWRIKYLESQPTARVSIFDRYGKLVYEFKGNGSGWNGKKMSVDLPSADYWFTVTLESGRVVKSHFSLKR
ncbi:MAG TPA: T9SS type B sorting domain-containing protein, partial [Flavobacterium sp.]